MSTNNQISIIRIRCQIFFAERSVFFTSDGYYGVKEFLLLLFDIYLVDVVPKVERANLAADPD